MSAVALVIGLSVVWLVVGLVVGIVFGGIAKLGGPEDHRIPAKPKDRRYSVEIHVAGRPHPMHVRGFASQEAADRFADDCWRDAARSELLGFAGKLAALRVRVEPVNEDAKEASDAAR